MEPEAIDIDEYTKSDVNARFYFLYKNYPIMIPLIKNYREDLISDVIDMKDYNRRAANGDLGVRVRVSLGTSRPTENQATSNIGIAKAIDEGVLDEDFFENTDNPEELIRRVGVYHRVSIDYEDFKNKIETLDPIDQSILKPYLCRQKTLADMADELGIGYRSIVNRMSKIKKRLSDKMEPRLMKGVIRDGIQKSRG